MAPLCGWLAVRAGAISSKLLTPASWAGAAAWATVGPSLAAGSTSARVASSTVAGARPVPIAAVVIVRRRHRGDRVVALPRASFKLQEVHPWSCYIEGLVAQFLLKVLIGLAPLKLYLQFALELAGVVLFLRHNEGGGDTLCARASSPADAVDEVVGG